MRRFEAVVRPQSAEAVCLALLECGLVMELEAREILGSGRRPSAPGAEPIIDVMPKAVVGGVVEDGDVDAVVDVILTHARSGRPGDGKIWVIPISAVAE